MKCRLRVLATTSMIKLNLPNKPAELTPEKELALFENNKKDPVWQKRYIKDAVFEIAYGKCAYSEVRLKEEGKDMQIDHFCPKVPYAKRVVEWGNLLPSLNHCNRHKSNIDPNNIDILNPLFDNPKDYLFFQNGLLCYKNAKGNSTIETLDLNNQVYINNPRVRLLSEIGKTLKDIGPWKDTDIVYFLQRIKDIMRKGTKKMAYSAAVSTFILKHSLYGQYKSFLMNESMWEDEFEIFEEELQFCSLPK